MGSATRNHPLLRREIDVLQAHSWPSWLPWESGTHPGFDWDKCLVVTNDEIAGSPLAYQPTRYQRIHQRHGIRMHRTGDCNVCFQGSPARFGQARLQLVRMMSHKRWLPAAVGGHEHSSTTCQAEFGHARPVHLQPMGRKNHLAQICQLEASVPPSGAEKPKKIL